MFFAFGAKPQDHAGTQPSAGDPLEPAIEAARRTRDEQQLRTLLSQVQRRASEKGGDAAAHFDSALVHSYLADTLEMRKDRKAAAKEVDQAIEAVERSIRLEEKSADAHSLLADLYGRKISLGNAMFAGPKYGPKVKEENKRAMELDEKNARVWASLGRQYLMAPKMFGGDIAKSIESFQKSLALNDRQDDTWVWLAQAFVKQGDKAKAREALGRAESLNPGSPFAKSVASLVQVER
ncbi:MAG: hypothetical protein C5B56_10355 [Proteobacteria bacterium]|nr:MAG: hypothetical protein C5B56_10355 [Pseudomonadota bacterium]